MQQAVGKLAGALSVHCPSSPLRLTHFGTASSKHACFRPRRSSRIDTKEPLQNLPRLIRAYDLGSLACNREPPTAGRSCPKYSTGQITLASGLLCPRSPCHGFPCVSPPAGPVFASRRQQTRRARSGSQRFYSQGPFFSLWISGRDYSSALQDRPFSRPDPL